MPPEVQARLSSIVVLRERTHRVSTDVDETSVHESTIKIKLWDKMSALQLLGRHLGMFRDKLEHSGEVTLMDALRRIEAREDELKQQAS